MQHIHLQGPLIKAAKALITEKPVSLGWSTSERHWAFIFAKAPSERAIKTAVIAGFDYREKEGYFVISLPRVTEKEIDTAVERFNLFAKTYKDLSKKTASILNRHINENAITISAKRAELQNIS